MGERVKRVAVLRVFHVRRSVTLTQRGRFINYRAKFVYECHLECGCVIDMPSHRIPPKTTRCPIGHADAAQVPA